jgi:hypothetical protein
MQRLMISIDMKDDEVLDKTAEQAVEGAVKNKVREFCEKRLDTFVDTITQQKLDNIFKPQSAFLRSNETKIKELVDKSIETYVKEVVMDMDIKNQIVVLLKERTAKKADDIIDRQLDTFDTKAYIDNIVSEVVKKVVSGHVLDILLENMDKLDMSK